MRERRMPGWLPLALMTVLMLGVGGYAAGRNGAFYSQFNLNSLLGKMLARNPATISDMARPFSVSFNAVSKHVMVLERAGLIERQVRGRQHFCRLRPLPLRQANAWLEQYRQFWELRFDALENYVAVKAKERRGQAHGKIR